ncbi:MAG TPA: ABC transporter permease [Terrimesophilobacter sp.]|nr:ABC transporter permease [Terrimesophilobacter sp.]
MTHGNGAQTQSVTAMPSRRLSDSLTKWVGRILLAAAVIFTIGPGILVVVLSFGNGTYIHFPPVEFGFEQYERFFTSRTWMSAFQLSILIGLATALVSLLVAIPAILAIYRTTMVGRRVLFALGMASILIPISAYAVALYSLYSATRLLGTPVGLIIAHTLVSVPLVLLIAGTALSRIPRELDLVAMTLGATRTRAILGITLRLLTPAIATTGILAFLTSFDEAVLVNFLGGVGLITLPKAIFDSVRYGIDPSITAIAGTLILLSALLMALRAFIERKSRQ